MSEQCRYRSTYEYVHVGLSKHHSQNSRERLLGGFFCKKDVEVVFFNMPDIENPRQALFEGISQIESRICTHQIQD